MHTPPGAAPLPGVKPLFSIRVLAVSLALTGCWNAHHAQVALRDNPDGADCFAQCTAAGTDAARTACVAACPGATSDDGVCGAGPTTACAQTRRLSRWKTAGLVVLGAVAIVAVAP